MDAGGPEEESRARTLAEAALWSDGCERVVALSSGLSAVNTPKLRGPWSGNWPGAHRVQHNL